MKREWCKPKCKDMFIYDIDEVSARCEICHRYFYITSNEDNSTTVTVPKEPDAR